MRLNHESSLDHFLNKPPYKLLLPRWALCQKPDFVLSHARQDGGEIIVVLGSEDHFTRFQDAKRLCIGHFKLSMAESHVR